MINNEPSSDEDNQGIESGAEERKFVSRGPDGESEVWSIRRRRLE